MSSKLWLSVALFVPLTAAALAQPPASFGTPKRLLAGILELGKGDPRSGLSTVLGYPPTTPCKAAPTTR